MTNKITVADLIAQLSDYNPESIINIGYATASWEWRGEDGLDSNSIETLDFSFTSDFCIGSLANGALLIGTEKNIEDYTIELNTECQLTGVPKL